MGRQPREELVRNLLRKRWDKTETFDLTPDISFGWYNSSKDVPQIVVLPPDEGPIGGGETGFDAIDPTGGRPDQTIDGVVEVHGFADGDGDLANATTDDPDQYLSGHDNQHGAMEEVAEIARDHWNAPVDPVTGNRPVATLAPGESSPVPDEDPGSRKSHYVIGVGYTFRSND